MFTFEHIHQMARDARAKGQNKVVLPHEEFSDAMQTFYAVTKGKRARNRNCRPGRKPTPMQPRRPALIMKSGWRSSKPRRLDPHN